MPIELLKVLITSICTISGTLGGIYLKQRLQEKKSREITIDLDKNSSEKDTDAILYLVMKLIVHALNSKIDFKPFFNKLHLREKAALRDLFYLIGTRSISQNCKLAIKSGQLCIALFQDIDREILPLIKSGKMSSFDISSQPIIQKLWRQLSSELRVENYFDKDMVERHILKHCK